MRFFFLFCVLSVSKSVLSSDFKVPLNFDATISINNESNQISTGYISYRDGEFLYNLTQPTNQIIANNKQSFFVQDNDFNQVIIYQNNNSFFLQELLSGNYASESFACPNDCFRVKPSDTSSFKDAIISLTDGKIEWIRILDIKDERIFIKFENFKVESTNISYVLPENYEIIIND